MASMLTRTLVERGGSGAQDSNAGDPFRDFWRRAIGYLMNGLEPTVIFSRTNLGGGPVGVGLGRFDGMDI